MVKWSEEEKITSTASEDFKKNLTGRKRYVDKTEILKQLLDGKHETSFFLRPRRFGKTLTLSMIRYFVEDTRDEALNAENRELFEGLKIMEAGEYYTSRMTSFPVINLTMQTIWGEDFDTAWQLLRDMISELYDSKSYLLQSDALTENEKDYFCRVQKGTDGKGREVTKADYIKSLKQLTMFLRRVTGKKTVLLLDEYDVPLEKAYGRGYYRQMVDVIGPMLQNVLMTNTENLQFAVVTGCLRIAKEGIYTGLNNPDVNTVVSLGKNDFIGFTEEEMIRLLNDSGVGEHLQEFRDWYDGYHFGDSVIYNPWSVIKHIEALNLTPKAPPMPYWANTSGNAIIRDLAARADADVKEKLETLMQGGEIAFSLQDNIVYDELYDEPDNVWNVMLAAGYLTVVDLDGATIRARIPNREVERIYKDQIGRWFRKSIKTFDIRKLYSAMEQGDADEVEHILTVEFLSAMSYYDTVEAFYHGVLLTLMQLNSDYICESNRESGAGRFDIMAKQRTRWDLAYVLEVKLSDDVGKLLEDARAGAEQIRKNEYVNSLQREGYRTIITYGLSFCKKRCRVAQGERICAPGAP